MKRACAVVALVALAAACGDSNPQKPSRAVTTLTVAPATDMIKLKATETYSVSATFTTGATEQVSAAWTSDNQAVVTVTQAGQATGAGPGQATLTATYEGKTATRPLRVVPDYAGRWAGTWTVSNCQVTGNLGPQWCGGVQGSHPATLELVQTRDAISGSWTLQEGNGTVQGSVAPSGALSLTGSSLQSGVTIEIGSWQTLSTDNQTMTGTFTLLWKISGQTVAQTTVTLGNFTKQ